MPKLEVAVHSLRSARAAMAGGADRIELCTALSTGGLTPGPGLLQATKNALSIPIHVLIRPRIGDFVYHEEELITMESSIRKVRTLGFPGVVIGCLDQDGTIQSEHLQRLMQAAEGMDITFHRAFDFTPDKPKALETLIQHGVRRVLTSGGAQSVMEGLTLLTALAAQSQDRIEVMPGAGINAQNLEGIMSAVRAPAYHASAKYPLEKSTHTGPDLGDAEIRFETSVEEVRRLARIIKGDKPT